MDFVPVDTVPEKKQLPRGSKYITAYKRLIASGKPALKTVCESRAKAQGLANSARAAVKTYGLRAKIVLRDREVYLVDLDYKYPQK